MSPRERRPALGTRKERRPHPVAPPPTPGGPRPQVRKADEASPEAPVMFSVRVPASLRRRLKLAALESGESVQQLVAEALEAECRRRGL